MAVNKAGTKNHLLTIFITPVLTGIFVLLGAYIALVGNHSLQTQQLRQESELKDKEQKKIIYFDFLDKTSIYYTATINAKDCLKKQLNRLEKTGKPEKLGCEKEISKMQSSGNAFQDLLNKVFVYGSEDAVNKIHDVANSLPPIGVTDRTSGEANHLKSIILYDENSITVPYQQFLEVSCKELPALPRTKCKII